MKMPAKKGEILWPRAHSYFHSPRAAKPQKRGVKSYFAGSRFEFLEARRDGYNSLRGKSRAKFWHELFEEWWQTYPWRLADNEEPPIGDTKKMEALSQVGDDAKLKSTVEERLEGVSLLHSWYRAFELIDIIRAEGEGMVQLPGRAPFPPRGRRLAQDPQARTRAGQPQTTLSLGPPTVCF